jgi:nucleotide-binding universal stress UspA family protein
MADEAASRPVLFAYDGSDHAKAAIRQAGEQLQRDRRAIVLTVWEPLGALPFASATGAPPEGLEDGFAQEAQRVADEGAELARSAGFDAAGVTERGDPIWQRIVDAADENDAAIIVMGSHGRKGVGLALVGSVAAATARHTERPVLIAHKGG